MNCFNQVYKQYFGHKFYSFKFNFLLKGTGLICALNCAKFMLIDKF